MKFVITESERNQIRNLYEQVTDESVLGGVPAKKLGLNPGQSIKDSKGMEVGKNFIGIGPNQGFTVKIMYGSNVLRVFNPDDKTTKEMSLDQFRNEYKERSTNWINTMKNKPNAEMPKDNYMSDEDVKKLNDYLKKQQDTIKPQ